MKKSIFVCVILSFVFISSVFAQKDPSSLVGVWQYCTEVQQKSGDDVMVCSPIWKVLHADGKFCQFMLVYKDGMCAMTHEGTYEVATEDTYVEHIVSHAVDKDLIGTKTVLHYRFINEDMVAFTYKLQGRNEEFREVWRRVKNLVESKK